MPQHKRSAKRGRYKQLGRARALAPVKERKDGRWTRSWLARYIDLDGNKRQAGVHPSKTDARDAAEQAVTLLNARREIGGDMTLAQWHDTWPTKIGIQERSRTTHEHRMAKYVLPHLPKDVTLRQINRAMLLDVQDALLSKRLSKRTIDTALGSLSAILGYALDRQLIEFNPALGLHVDENDQRLRPKRPAKRRRFVPADELATFLVRVPSKQRAVCSAPALTGVRTQELFGLRGEEIRHEDQLIYVYQRAHRYGGQRGERLIDGIKTTRGAQSKSKEELGRFTLFPTALIEMISPAPDARMIGLLFPSPRGRVWSQRNFYRDVWEPAKKRAKADFTLYDLRHTWVTLLSDAGIPDAEISLYSGHSFRSEGSLDNTMTRVYRHATGRWLAPALTAVDAYWTQVLEAEREMENAVRRAVGMTVAGFMRAYEAGDLDDADPAVSELVGLLRIGQRTAA
jgi:integrase